MKKLLLITAALLLILFISGCVDNDDPMPTPCVTEEPAVKEIAAEDILEGMTLEEKAAQLLMVSCHTQGLAEKASEYGVGALCLYAFDFEGKSKEEVIEMTGYFQSLSKYPLIISTDEEGGDVHRISINPQLYEDTFRSPSELKEANELTSVAIDTRAKCVLMEELGINTNLAPVCDVPLREKDYIHDRCYSMDYNETAEFIETVVNVMRDYNVACVLKHFPGYGGSGDTHLGMAYDSRPYDDFLNGDLLPFKAGINAGADAVMVSHNIVKCMDNKNPASLSPEVHRILREELGFDGIIVTDDLAMGAILKFGKGKNMVVQALLAGNDMVCCSNYEESVQAIIEAVNDGTLNEADIDSSVIRVLELKIKLGLINIKSRT